MQRIQIDRNTTIEFTPGQLQMVLNALSERPFKEVSDLINYIQNQVMNQLKPKTETK